MGLGTGSRVCWLVTVSTPAPGRQGGVGSMEYTQPPGQCSCRNLQLFPGGTLSAGLTVEGSRLVGTLSQAAEQFR